MQCPKCLSIPLQTKKAKSSDVMLDACASCKGVWFDADELNSILVVASQELSPPNHAKPSDLACPRCHVALSAFNYPQTYVEIDMCGSCHGLWLTTTEFKEIKAVREHFKKKGELEVYAPVTGFKGTLLTWIDGAINFLTDFD